MIKKVYMLALLLVLAACSKVPVGFLQTSDATYKPNRIYAYHIVEEGTPWSKGAPFTSTEIQGVAGTQPVNYEFHSVKVSEGGDEAKFMEAFRSGGFLVRGSYIQLFPDAAKSLPKGKYTISLRVYNESYSDVLNDIFTFVVKEAYEEGDDSE